MEISDPTIEPDGPSPEEQLAGIYELIRLDGPRDWLEDFDLPVKPPNVTGTLTIFAGDSFSHEYTLFDHDPEGGIGQWSTTFSSDDWEANTTNIFCNEENPREIPESISYTWQGTDRTILILKVRPSPLRPWHLPDEYTTVWKRVE